MPPVEVFTQHRPLLFSIAYGMLGTIMDAEDIVQEAYLRWERAPQPVAAPRAYLATIVTRLSIDRLRLARMQREQYVGAWLPEPVVTDSAATADEWERLEALPFAFLVLLERLNPAERAVFLLREVFDYDYGEIAGMVGKSPAACRQVAHRAQQRLGAPAPRHQPSAEQQQQLVAQFVRALTEGDLAGLLALLAEDIASWVDGGGQVTAALRPVRGADSVARLLLGLAGHLPPGFAFRLASVNGQAALVCSVDGQVNNVLVLDISDERIRAIYGVLNPDKLQRVAARPLIEQA